MFHLKRFCRISPLLLLLASPSLVLADCDTPDSVCLGSETRTIPTNFLGFNVNFSEAAQLDCSGNAVETDRCSLLAELASGALRYPGGTLSSYFNQKPGPGEHYGIYASCYTDNNGNGQYDEGDSSPDFSDPTCYLDRTKLTGSYWTDEVMHERPLSELVSQAINHDMSITFICNMVTPGSDKHGSTYDFTSLGIDATADIGDYPFREARKWDKRTLEKIIERSFKGKRNEPHDHDWWVDMAKRADACIAMLDDAALNLGLPLSQIRVELGNEYWLVKDDPYVAEVFPNFSNQSGNGNPGSAEMNAVNNSDPGLHYAYAALLFADAIRHHEWQDKQVPYANVKIGVTGGYTPGSWVNNCTNNATQCRSVKWNTLLINALETLEADIDRPAPGLIDAVTRHDYLFRPYVGKDEAWNGENIGSSLSATGTSGPTGSVAEQSILKHKYKLDIYSDLYQWTGNKISGLLHNFVNEIWVTESSFDSLSFPMRLIDNNGKECSTENMALPQSDPAYANCYMSVTDYDNSWFRALLNAFSLSHWLDTSYGMTLFQHHQLTHLMENTGDVNNAEYLDASGKVFKLWNRAIGDLTLATKLNFGANNGIVDGGSASPNLDIDGTSHTLNPIPQLHGWRFSNTAGTERILILNLSTHAVSIDLQQLPFSPFGGFTYTPNSRLFVDMIGSNTSSILQAHILESEAVETSVDEILINFGSVLDLPRYSLLLFSVDKDSNGQKD